MNIWIVCYPTFGWSGIVATELGKALAKKWNNVHFISSDQPTRLDVFKEHIFYHEVTATNYPLFTYIPYESALTSKLVDIVKHEKLDILHVHYALPHASAAYMAQQILKKDWVHIPFITTLHGTDITIVWKDASYEPVIAFAIDQSNAVTAVSESLKQDTYTNFQVTNDIQVIPNFVNFEYGDRFDRDNELKKKFAPNDERIIIHVSNLRKVKRVKDVISTFDIIRKKIPSKLLIVGDGPERWALEQQCRTLDLCEHIHFLWKIKKVEKILKIGDLFLLPSESESFGLAALEAMSAGIPVVSSNVWGISEVNIHRQTGYLADVKDVKSMATYALEILSSDSTLEKFRTQAQIQAKKFCIHTILPMYEDLYKRTIAKTLK